MLPMHRSSLGSLVYHLGKLLEAMERRKQREANEKLEKAIRELGLTPVCKHCHSNFRMKLISWKDKETGMLKRAYKCEACNRWFYR